MTKNRRHKINSNMTLSKWIFFAATCGVVFELYLQWKNYADVLKDRVFWKALKNDLIITLIKEILICSLTVLFAVTLTRFRMKTPEVVLYKFVFYIPNVISTIIIGSLWGFVFMPSGMGLMNSICSIFKSGVDVDWVTKYPLGVIGFVASWCGVGLFMLTMPAVWLQVTFMVVSILYQSLGGNFGLVNVFAPNGGLDNNAMVMGLYVYRYGYSGKPIAIGYSYAAALVMLVITCVISLSVKYAMNKVGESL